MVTDHWLEMVPFHSIPFKLTSESATKPIKACVIWNKKKKKEVYYIRFFSDKITRTAQTMSPNHFLCELHTKEPKSFFCSHFLNSKQYQRFQTVFFFILFVQKCKKQKCLRSSFPVTLKRRPSRVKAAWGTWPCQVPRDRGPLLRQGVAQRSQRDKKLACPWARLRPASS